MINAAAPTERELADTARVLASLPRRLSDIPRLAHIDPAAQALRFGTRRWSFAALAAATDSTAAALAGAGIRAGDRVMIVGENCPALVALLLGAARLDAWAVIVNARLSPREIDLIAAALRAPAQRIHGGGFA